MRSSDEESSGRYLAHPTGDALPQKHYSTCILFIFGVKLMLDGANIPEVT